MNYEDETVIPALPDDYTPPTVQYLDERSPTPITTSTGYPTPTAQNNLQTGLLQTDRPSFIPNLTLMDLVQMAVVYAFVVAAALSAVFIFVGGISFILSGGNDEKVKQAINTIRYSIIGLIITILSFTFVVIIGKIFHLDLMSYISYNQIKNSIEKILPQSQPAPPSFNVQ